MYSPYHITIKLPKETKLKSLKTDIALGEPCLEKVTSAKNHISLNLGELTLTDSEISYGDIEVKVENMDAMKVD